MKGGGAGPVQGAGGPLCPDTCMVPPHGCRRSQFSDPAMVRTEQPKYDSLKLINNYHSIIVIVAFVLGA